jgi:hypothetical protein
MTVSETESSIVISCAYIHTAQRVKITRGSITYAKFPCGLLFCDTTPESRNSGATARRPLLSSD